MLRIPQCLHGLSRPCLRCLWRFHGRGTILRLRATYAKFESEERTETDYDQLEDMASDTITYVPEAKNHPAATLSRVPIFSGLTEGESKFLSERAVYRHFPAGKIVFSEG